MPLSLEKLENLLALKGFIPNKYFIMNKLCVYIEVISISNADMFLLYIPSKYKFKVKHKENYYKIKYIDIQENNENTADAYAGAPDDYDLEKEYDEIEIGMSPNIKGANIESKLEENYKRTINLKDISSDDNKEIKDIIRQLKRLKFCVQNVKYKISILYKNYMCCIRRDDEIDCYTIRKFPSKDSRKLYITVDLELFYNKMDSLMLNMETIRTGIYHILDKNQFRHTHTLKKLLEDKSDIVGFSDNSYKKKIEYEKYLKDLQSMLVSVNKSEEEIFSRLDTIKQKYGDGGLKGLHNDIEKSHQISKLQTELSNIEVIRNDIIKNIFEIKTKRDNTMLAVDKIMFDNTVMLECMLRNFSVLGKIC